MQIWYTIPTDVGQARYGSDFSNYQRITAYHNTDVRGEAARALIVGFSLQKRLLFELGGGSGKKLLNALGPFEYIYWLFFLP